MPTTREKSSRRRTGSTSSDSGLPHSLPSPRSHTLPEEESDPLDLDGDISSLRLESSTTTLTCCNPRGCVLGPIEGMPTSDQDLVRMVCTNEKCPCSMFMHSECFESFEEQILSCLRGMSRARNWSEKQRKQNLWTKKGYDLIFRFCTCRCGKGTLRKDLNHVLPEATPSSSSTAVMIAASSNDKTKKKRKKSTSLSEKSPLSITPLPPRSRSHSQRNSDSFSSDNGVNYLQPFAHRTDYSIFDRLLPRHLVNGYHIKMEDDGYAAGDDTRSFVLSSLAFHHTNMISCVLCEDQLSVYDRYPLINGTFYLSPKPPRDNSLEVEGKGDDPQYISAICLRCMVGLNNITCKNCHQRWNGTFHQIGTMYSFDLFAATPCCASSVQCNNCQKPLVDHSKLSLSFTQLSSLFDCPHCSSRDFHFLKPMTRYHIDKRSLESQ